MILLFQRVHCRGSMVVVPWVAEPYELPESTQKQLREAGITSFVAHLTIKHLDPFLLSYN